MRNLKDKFKYLSRVSYSFVKSNVVTFIIVLCVFLLEIPRINGIIGSDAFEILWMSNALVEGLQTNSTWIINSLSIFGFYPFSFYPVGYPFVISLFFRAGVGLNLTTYLISSINIVIASIGATKLGKKVFQRDVLQKALLISYLFAPVFIRFTYFTISARGPILALAPWLFYYYFDSQQKFSIRSTIKLSIIMIIMAFLHRLWLAYLPIILVAVLANIISRKTKIINLIKKHKQIFYTAFFVICLSLLIAGYFVFRVDSAKITSPWFSNNNFFGLIANLIIDYGLRLGLLTFFLPLSIYNLLKDIPNEENKKRGETWIFYIFLIFILSFVWTYTLYSTVAYLPIYALISINGLKTLLEKNKPNTMLIITITMVSFVVLFSVIYESLINNNYLNAIITTSVLLPTIAFYILFKKDLVFAEIKSLKKTNVKAISFIVVILLSNIFFCLNSIDGQILLNEQEFPYSYISDEEMDICKFLNNEGVVGTIYVSNSLVSRRISGYGFLPTINGNHAAHQLYYGWADQTEISENFSFNFYYFVTNPKLLVEGVNPENSIINELLCIPVNSSENINHIVEMNIQYAVILKDSLGNAYPYHISSAREEYSIFIDSLHLIPSVYQTENLLVWKFF